MEDAHKTVDKLTASFAGFRIRLLAALIDTVWLSFLLTPLIFGLGYLFYGSGVSGSPEVLVAQLMAGPVAIVLFWIYRQATPGKMMTKTRIVDARTGGRPSKGQLVGRYFGYYVAMMPLFIGIFWIIFDKRKQGWHDKLSRTVVLRVVPH